MADDDIKTTPTRLRWPWFALAALVLGIGLAVLWMTIEVRRIRQQRNPNPWAAPSIAHPAN